MRNLLFMLFIIACGLSPQATGGEVLETDVCVYGGTASGITAALAAKRRGESVIIVEPMRLLGGIPGGGISISWDCLYADDIGGIAKELHDADDLHQWKVRLMLKGKVEEAGIRYFTEHRLDSKDDVFMNGSTIEKIHLNYAPIMTEGVPPAQPTKRKVISIKAKVFIDASYEGDLMAFSGVKYTVGREARSTYNETLAGQRSLKYFDIDPYVEEGNPESGLLPMITDDEAYEEGAASRYFMAYNFRLLGWRGGKRGFVGVPRVPLKPLGREIDKVKYALVIRALKKDPNMITFPIWNYKRTGLVSSSIPGAQVDYPDGNWAVRSAYWRGLIDHVKTMCILTKPKTSPLIKGMYPENDDFPDQLYIRLGRRMVGRYVMSQHDLMHQTNIEDPIGLGYYGVDLYPSRLFLHEGKVATEGIEFTCVSPGPYQIAYRALTPKKEEVDNLIVPVCMSASHVAMSSIRMESSYVVMGEAAGIAASHAVKSGKKVQDIDYAALRADMDKAGVITEWNGKGYGPKAKTHWNKEHNYWLKHMEEYNKIPIRLDPSWLNYKKAALVSNGMKVAAFSSVEDWNRKKSGYEWLFPHIDKNADGKISLQEHQAFQDYKKKHKDWSTTLKAKPLQN